MGCYAGTCPLSCLQASSADKVLGTKESCPKSLLFISIKGVLFHLLTIKTGRIIMVWLLWSWSQWWKKSYEAELRGNCLKSWLQGFTLMSSCKALLDKEYSFWCGSCKKKKKAEGGGGRREWDPFLGPLSADPRQGYCPASWFCASCQPWAPRHAGSLSHFFSALGMIPHWFIGLQFSKWHHFPFFSPLLTSLLLNSRLSHFHFPVLWNGNNTFQLPPSAVCISCLLTPSPRHH